MEWKTSPELVPYEEAVSTMEARVRQIQAGEADECIWLLEHPPVYTAGTSAKDSDLVDTLGFPVYKTGRGGQYTYHGPGQRVAYVMLDLKKRTMDVRYFVKQLEQWIIATLDAFGVKGIVRDGRVGVWVKAKENTIIDPSFLSPLPSGRGQRDLAVQRTALVEQGEGDFTPHLGLPKDLAKAKSKANTSSPSRGEENQGPGLCRNDENARGVTELKIAALGIRIRQWVTYHGISINVNPDLEHYRGIIPCGIREHGVTSLAALGVEANMKEVDKQLVQTFRDVF